MDDLTASLEQSTKEARKEKIYSTLYHKNYSLGRGGYGEAWLIESKKSDKKMVLKEVDLTEMDEEEIEEALGEASIMKLFNHPNIIGIKDVFKTKSGMLNIIMEYAEKGDLGNIIDDKKKKLNAGDKSVYFEE